MTIDNSIRLLEDYLKWEKQLGLDGSGLDDATNKLLEVAKKYQKIEYLIENRKLYMANHYTDEEIIKKIKEVIEWG